jgi:quercetin dioxygenase-like cupin family protein
LKTLERVCQDLDAAIEELRSGGFRLDVIYPADEPHTAVLTNGGTSVRLTTKPEAAQACGVLPPLQPEFVLTRATGEAAQGRAGMLYRDLIPGRLGGRYIASHITIPQGGPVSDWVHFHRIALQLICVRKGWVRVVYQDQGEPFVMNAGDLVLQPPGIRHQVLESSAGLEVIEVSCPALHETFADHEMNLPTGRFDPGRLFSGQRFLHHVAKNGAWRPFGGGEAQETGVDDATCGLAEVRSIRRAESGEIDFAPHDRELVFGFVLEGSTCLDYQGTHALGPADAFVIRPGEPWSLGGASPDFRLLHVTTSRLG